MKYVLDTNTCIYVINKRPKKVLQRIRSLPAESIALPMMTVAELYYGSSKSDPSRRDENLQAVRSFLTPFAILQFDESDAEEFGRLKAVLRRRGEGLADLDIAIAAQALTRKLILVTNNTRHFKRIPDISIENWIA